MESSRLPARLTAYIEAIDAARAAGVTWKQIAEAFGVAGKGRPKYFAEAVKIARQGKYTVQEQKPLPEPEKRRQQVQQVHGDYGGFDKPKPKRVFDDDK